MNDPESKTEAKSNLEKIPFKRITKMIGLSSMASLLEHRVALPTEYRFLLKREFGPNSSLIGFEFTFFITMIFDIESNFGDSLTYSIILNEKKLTHTNLYQSSFFQR